MLLEQEVEKIVAARRITARSLEDHYATSAADAGGAIAEKLGVAREQTKMLKILGEGMIRFQLEANRARSREEIASVASKALVYIRWLKIMESRGQASLKGNTGRQIEEITDLAKEAKAGTQLRSGDVDLLLLNSTKISRMPFAFHAAALMGKDEPKFRNAFNKALRQIEKRTHVEWTAKTN
jgi:hypothetical protein